MAYGNVTPPTLPTYDAETNGFYLLVFNYELGAENWYMVHLIYGAWRFQYDEGVGITNTGNTFTRTYSDGVWSEESQNTVALALNPGPAGNVYQRIYTNANIFNGDDIWLAENTVTPLDEEQRQINMKSQLAGFLASWVSRVRQFPHREPVEQEPGTPIAEYNLLDFGGSWRGDNIEDASGEASYTRIAFSVGGFPLHFTTKWVLSVNSEVVAPFNWVSLESLPFKAGERVRIEVRFPESDFGELEYDFRRVSYSFNDAGLWSRHYFEITYESNQSQLICKQLKMFVSYDLNEVHDPNGRLVGFVLDGVLESDLVSIDITDQAVSITNEKPTTFSLTTKFTDYDSLKIAVYEQEE